MELCNVCSQLDLTFGFRDSQTLGPYEELLSKSHGIGPGRGGCGGCAFFCAVLQTSRSWSSRISELTGRVVVFHSKRLDVRTTDDINGSSYSVDDLLFDICTENENPGALFVSWLEATIY
jgi:hypothetical protein